MISVQNISKSFDDNHVLKNISVDFHPGKVNFIIGRSGSGKSVLTKCIVGLMEVNDGEIHFDGRSFTKMNHWDRRSVRQEMGMLFQGSALFDSMTVEENVKFPLKMFSNMTAKEMQERVDFCLDRVNLNGKNDLFPSEISGGMQKRTGIARAIAMNPKYLFCDEPNSGLDPETAIVIDNLIREITYEFNITTVVISHDMNSVIEIGDYINFIYKGEMCWQGDRNSILRTDNEILNNFVFPSEFMKEIKDVLRSSR
ncbi:MAG: ATP-binding cassette domain-containing protein [Flavobacteriales bacterium]